MMELSGDAEIKLDNERKVLDFQYIKSRWSVWVCKTYVKHGRHAGALIKMPGEELYQVYVKAHTKIAQTVAGSLEMINTDFGTLFHYKYRPDWMQRKELLNTSKILILAKQISSNIKNFSVGLEMTVSQRNFYEPWGQIVRYRKIKLMNRVKIHIGVVHLYSEIMGKYGLKNMRVFYELMRKIKIYLTFTAYGALLSGNFVGEKLMTQMYQRKQYLIDRLPSTDHETLGQFLDLWMDENKEHLKLDLENYEMVFF
jgi:hypothetical protein